MTRNQPIGKSLAFGALLPLLTFQAWAQKGSGGPDWRYISGDAGGTKYSPLDQISASNVSNLKIAWRWKSENYGARPDYNWEVTPLAVNGKLYFSAGMQRAARLPWTAPRMPSCGGLPTRPAAITLTA